ncbi:MAG: M13 family metallopeptidase [Cellulosilyticum sp.]|nr:M13 family metallopeptidase [Cellulosilyticum sp.]
MKLVKKMSKQLAALLMAMMLGLTPQLTMAEETANVKQEKQEIRLEDDFYEYINKEWLETTTLKPGYPATNTFNELNDKCQEQLQQLFAEILGNGDKYGENDIEKKMVNLYNNYLNKEVRNKQGTKPIKPYLDKIAAIQTLEDLETYLSDIMQSNMAGIYGMSVSTDFKDSNQKIFTISSTNLILGGSDDYNKPTEQSKITSAATTKYLQNILVLMGYSKEEAAKKVEDAYTFEKLLTPYILGQEEASKMSNVYEIAYNVYTLDELDQLAPNLNLKTKIQKICGDKADRVNVLEPKWLEALNTVYTEENVDAMKNYIEIKFLRNTVGALGEDFEKIADEYTAELTGVQGDIPVEQEAMQVISSIFSDKIGKLYVEKYFSKEAKEDVETLVNEIIATYKKKLENVDWMADSTKANAIKKLDTMKVKIGYPDEWEDYEGLEIKSYEEGGSLIENLFNIESWSYEEILAEMDKPVDKTIFAMSPQTVNACYNPTCNDITFPAAILQHPFYDVNRSKEENLGSIGAVIAHEISHAFDNSGANFDENGNVNEWWTKEDYAKFEEKAQTVRDFYSNVTVDSGAKVNGDLTVGENIADITAVSCMLDIMEEMDNADYKAFFESWATTWRMIGTDEYKALLLEQDPHSPDKVRANVVLQQFQEFYDTYGIKEGDGMYVKPENRLKIY